MNAFEQHGIDHLSASSINSYASDQGMWCINYLLRQRTGGPAFLARGKAVEEGVQHLLKNPNIGTGTALKLVLQTYDEQTASTGEQYFEDVQDNRSKLAGYLVHAYEAISVYEKMESYQKKVEVNLFDIPVPFVGYTDWVFYDAVLDLKTTERLPSEISASHARQGAVYHSLYKDKQMHFAYVKPVVTRKGDKFVVLEQKDFDSALKSIEIIAEKMRRFLALSKDKEELVGLAVPNYENFMWNDEESRNIGKKVYGF